MVNAFAQQVVGQSPYACAVRRFIEEACATAEPVLLMGEPGTGKELTAKLIHQASPRRKAPFLMIDCSLFYEKELKRELYGYRAGSGADSERKGILEFASKGTCYLSRIEELSLALQADLLEFLVERRFSRLGDGKEVASDARIVASSDKNLDGFVQAGLFNRALHERLSRHLLHLLPLRERKEDIPHVAAAMAAAWAGERSTGAAPTFAPEAVEALQSYPWPANFEELRREVLRLCDRGLRIVRPENLAMEIASFWLGGRGDPEIRKAIEEIDGYIREFRILSRLEPCLGAMLCADEECAFELHRDILEEL
jgi:DNA-binding NtrC family response regulator